MEVLAVVKRTNVFEQNSYTVLCFLWLLILVDVIMVMLDAVLLTFYRVLVIS